MMSPIVPAHLASDSRPLHVILGAGQIAQLLADRLLARGVRVRLVRRSNAGPHRDGLEWAFGDLRDRSFAEAATRGASVVYQCSAPPYEKWLDELEPVWRGGLHGATRAGAKYVILDNMYMYGRVSRETVDENTPVNPVSRKGELRARVAAEAMAAHQRGDVRVAIGRASDFVGPGVTVAVVFHGDFYQRTLAGLPAQVPGDPDQLHSYSFSHEVADGLLTLGLHEEALGKIWHLPVLPPESTRSLVARMQRALGMTPAIDAVPDAVLAQLGLTNPVVREIVEMTYLYHAPFVVDDRRFRSAFTASTVSIETAVALSAEWARATFAGSAPAFRAT